MRTRRGLYFYGDDIMEIKKPTTIDEQVELLKSRGLIFSNEEEPELREWLININYYRLSGYWWIYECKAPDCSPREHKFQDETTWKQVKRTYIFDQKFRRLISIAIEKVEVSIKARWSQYLAEKCSCSHPHEQKSLFQKDFHDDYTYKKLVSSYNKSTELYSCHYKKKYPELKTPPIWVCALLLTLGEMLNWLKSLNKPLERNNILRPYGFDESVLISFLTHLTWVRNTCAHNGRLWNRKTNKLFTAPTADSEIKDLLIFNTTVNNRLDSKIYNTLLMLHVMLHSIDKKFLFLSEVKDLIKQNTYINPTHMGFPENWEELKLWKTLPLTKSQKHRKNIEDTRKKKRKHKRKNISA
ncbi:MAG: Abi family protein [Veillonella sp.]|nr:Abi family protein [Veillonella sp.]